MFRNRYRVLKEGGIYIGCDVHPFQRPFDGENKYEKAKMEVNMGQIANQALLECIFKAKEKLKEKRAKKQDTKTKDKKKS